MGTWRITANDRDAAGSIKVDSVAPVEPRSLADLLPAPEEIRKDAQRQPWTRTELAGLAAVAVCAVLIVFYAWSTPNTPTAPPQARTTAVATTAATAAPTRAPTAAPAALVGYFDYDDPTTAAAITAPQITRVIGRAGDDWRLVQAGDARVWIAAGQVPAGTPAVDPLPDLTRRPPISTSAPVVAPVPCTRDIAPYVVSRRVLLGTLPIGEAMGFSCSSAAEAEANASAHEAEVRSSYAKTSQAGR